MPKTFVGRTVDAEAPFLNAEFWREGVEVSGVVTKVFETVNAKEGGPDKRDLAYVLTLDSPVEINGEEVDRVSIGSMAGVKMALDAMGIPRLHLKDAVTILCEGSTPSKKENYSPRSNFKISVTRA